MHIEINYLKKFLNLFQIIFSWLVFIFLFALMFEPIRFYVVSLLSNVGLVGGLVVMVCFAVLWMSVWGITGYVFKNL